MFRSRNQHRRRRLDAPTPSGRRSHSRRLTIEAMESRLLLSGNEGSGNDLDYAIWNLDSIRDNYEIISQGNSPPAASTSTSSASGPAGAQIDVSWVTVPGMTLSASDARNLSYHHYRTAMSQGLINSQQAASLYNQWRVGFTSDPNASTAPVYAIGVRNFSTSPAASNSSDSTGGGILDSDSAINASPISVFSPSGFVTTSPADVRNAELNRPYSSSYLTNGAGYTVLRDRVYDNLGSSIGGANSIFGTSVLVGAPSYDIITLPVWNSDYTGTGVYITVGDDGHDSLQLSSGNSVDLLGLHGTSTAGVFGSSLTDLISVANPGFNYRDVQEILVRSARGVGTTAHGLVDAELAVKLASSWSDPFSLSDPGYDILDFGNAVVDGNVAAATSAIGAHAQYINFMISGEVARNIEWNSPTAGQAILVGVVDAAVAMPHADMVAAADAGAQASAGTSGRSLRYELSAKTSKSTSDANLAEAVDELLAQDAIFVDNSPQTNSDGVAAELTQSNANTHAAGTVVVATIDGSSDGGMVAIQELVDAASNLPIPSADEYVASAESVTPIVGELTRVAVMELIEGEADPAAPQQSADHTSLVAANEGIDILRQTDGGPGAEQTSSEWAIEVFAEQSGRAMAIFSPVNPGYLAAIAGALSDAFATAPISESTEAPIDAARNAAFSQFGDEESDDSHLAADDESSLWLSAAPLLVALACERVVAAKKKRQQQPHQKPQPITAR